jgi:peptidoglycan/LPS O-acetylase OafA/YrhL
MEGAALVKILTGPGFFRIVLASLVFLAHMSDLRLGIAAVYIFFTLSGFWIARLWAMKYSKSSRAYRIFLVSRLWRLWPVFILSTALTWGLFCVSTYLWAPFGYGWDPSKADIPWQIVSNLVIFGYADLPRLARINNPMWSLDIEAQFYLLVPAILFLLSKGRSVIALLLLVSVASVLFIHAYILPRYMAFFIIGILAEQSKWQPSRRTGYTALAGSVALVALLIVLPKTHGLLIMADSGDGPGIEKYNHLFSALLAVSILPWTVFTTFQTGWKFDRALADLSFIFYAVHYPVLRFFNVVDDDFARAAIAFGVILAVIVAFWHYDQVLEHWRSAWVARQVKAYPKRFRGAISVTSLPHPTAAATKLPAVPPSPASRPHSAAAPP